MLNTVLKLSYNHFSQVKLTKLGYFFYSAEDVSVFFLSVASAVGNGRWLIDVPYTEGRLHWVEAVEEQGLGNLYSLLACNIIRSVIWQGTWLGLP